MAHHPAVAGRHLPPATAGRWRVLPGADRMPFLNIEAAARIPSNGRRTPAESTRALDGPGRRDPLRRQPLFPVGYPGAASERRGDARAGSSRSHTLMAAAEIRVTLPDGSRKALPAGATGADLAKAIGPGP